MQQLFTKDFFELFNLPVSFDIDASQLTERYRALQSSVHPDRFAAASDQDRRLSVQMAAHINEAYQTLKQPLSRARYLLEHFGVDVARSSTALDMEFLAEQIVLREQLSEIRDQVNPMASLLTLREELQQSIASMQQDFSNFIGQGESSDVELARAVFDKLQFFYRLQQEVNLLEEELFS